MPRSVIGARLRDARERAGLRRETVADRTGKSISTIYGYESGLFDPSLRALYALAALYNVTPGDLLDEEVSADAA